MAQTIDQAPSSGTTVYNEMAYLLDSSNDTQDNFRHVLDVHVDGVTDPYRLKVFPNPDNGKGLFDVHRVLEPYVSHDLNLSNYGFKRNSNSYIKYTAKAGEEYGPSSGLTVYAALTTDSDRYAFNGIVDFQRFLDTQDYIIGAPSSGTTFLTNMPDNVYIGEEDNAWLYMAIDAANAVSYMKVITYEADGTQIQEVHVDNTYAALSNDDDRFLRFSSGTSNLNLIDGGDLSMGSQPIIDSATAYYTLQTFNSGDAATSKIQRYTIKDYCGKYTAYRVHFLNEMGGIDSFTFNKRLIHDVDVSRKQFKKSPGSISGTSYGYNITDRTREDYHIRMNDRYTIHSDFISEAEAAWLEELITTRQAYIENSLTEAVAINILNTQYRSIKDNDDKAYSLALTYRYSYDRKR